MSETDSHIDGKIVEVQQLVREVTNRGNYAFLIGAGASSPPPADIPTGGELISRWQKKCHNDSNSAMNRKNWVKQRESNKMGDDESKYGFWFEQFRTTEGGRRDYIKNLVEDAKPTVGHVILASMMSDSNGQKNIVPVTLTPNFDGLMSDALNLYIEGTAQEINHEAVSTAFKLTRREPSVVKLHGDYLYDNVQNVSDEVANLEEGMERILQETIKEHGLVVAGYSGRDDSIMNALAEAEEYSEYEIFWCVHDKGDEDPIDQLSHQVRELIQQTPSHVVPIDGFVPLMLRFGRKLPGADIPSHNEMTTRAQERADQLLDEISRHSVELFVDSDDPFNDSAKIVSSIVEDPTNDEINKFMNYFLSNLLKNSVDKMSKEELEPNFDTEDEDSADRTAILILQKAIKSNDLVAAADQIDDERVHEFTKSKLERILDLDPETDSLGDIGDLGSDE